MKKQRYESDIKLGERYRDDQTGYEGVATAIYFFQHACERVTVETFDRERQEVKEQTFDAPGCGTSKPTRWPPRRDRAARAASVA